MAIPPGSLQTEFDFQNPACFTNGGTAITDLSGNGNNFTLNNTAYTFDGTYGSILFPSGTYADGTPSDYAFGTAAFSILAWVKFNTSVPGINISHFGGSGTGERTYFYWRSSDNFIVSDNAGSAGGWVEAADNEWHLLALTRPASGTVASQKAFIDGVEIAYNPANFYNGSATLNATLGAARLHDTVYGATGDLELATYDVYTAEISAGDILAYYNSTKSRFIPKVASFDPGNIASYPGTGTTLFDLSGNGNDLTLVGGPTFVNKGLGSYFQYDGVNDIARRIGLNNVTSSTVYTLSFWINYQQTVYGSYAAPILVGFDGAPSNAALSFTNYPGQGYAHAGLSSGGTVNSATIPLNEWKYYSITSDGTTVKLYEDGVLYDSSAASGAIGNTPYRAFSLGAFVLNNDPDQIIYPVNCKFGIVDFYSQALDAGTILQNYEDTKDRYVLPTVEYDFQNGSYPGVGTTITDLQGANTNLTVGNGHWVSGTPNYFDLQGDTNLFNTSPGGSFSSTTFTVNCWYYTDFTNPTFYHTVWSIGLDGNPTRPLLATQGDNTMNIQWSFGYGIVPYTPTIGWHLFTFKSNGTTTSLFVDGVFQGSNSSSSGSVASPYTIRLGCGNNNSNNPVEFGYGKIGYWSYYDVALDATQILDLYNATSGSYAPAPAPSSNGVGGRQFAQGFNG